MRLHKHITRAAAFWHHVEFVLSARCGRSDPKKSSCANGCSLIRYRTLAPVGCQTVDRPDRQLARLDSIGRCVPLSQQWRWSYCKRKGHCTHPVTTVRDSLWIPAAHNVSIICNVISSHGTSRSTLSKVGLPKISNVSSGRRNAGAKNGSTNYDPRSRVGDSPTGLFAAGYSARVRLDRREDGVTV